MASKLKRKVTRKRKYQQVVKASTTNKLRAVVKRPSHLVTAIHLAIIRLELRKRGAKV